MSFAVSVKEAAELIVREDPDLAIDERQAFERLRDHARATSQRVVDVAEGVLDGHVVGHVN
jgi:hypothetical protein